MVSALLVDGILLLMLLMLIPIGMARGGVREICSATGVLLGLLITQIWAPRWGERFADATTVGNNTAQFVTAIGTLVLVTLLVGYGAGASFTYVPGPGGRIYGGLISFMAGLVFLGAVINYVRQYLYEGEDHDLIDKTYLARGLADGLDWVLLGVVLIIAAATAFGAFVRDPSADQTLGSSQPSTAVQPARSPTIRTPLEPVKLDPATPAAETSPRTASVRIKEIRHWEEPAQQEQPATTKGDWAQTWPSGTNLAGSVQPTQTSPQPSPDRDGALLREWLAEEEPPRNPPKPRRSADE